MIYVFLFYYMLSVSKPKGIWGLPFVGQNPTPKDNRTVFLLSPHLLDLKYSLFPFSYCFGCYPKHPLF